jgi:heptosyltransferase I
MALPLQSPPHSICLLRLSAIGDISHTLPIVRTLQAAWPDTHITWIIGRTEYGLVGDIPGIEFIVFDKGQGRHAYTALRQQLRGRRFDVLLHMQMSIRASIASLLVKATIRLGFDRMRAKDMQWLFTNHKIEAREREHVLDSFFGFTEALGIKQHVLAWDIPIPQDADDFVQSELGDKPYLVISPCSSVAYRNWHSQGYAEVALHAIREHGLHVVLSGGNTALERQYAAEISARVDAAGEKKNLSNLVSRTNLKQLLALLKRARLLISPDSGPAHLATAVGTQVIGLYACTNPERARPYQSKEYVINKYPEAITKVLGKKPDEVAWGERIKSSSAMGLIKTEDVVSIMRNVLFTQ